MADEQTLNHIMNEYEELRISAANERKKRIEEVNKKVEEVVRANVDAKIYPTIRRCKYGNDANKLGALYNFLQRQNLL